jgi:putative ABC transport system permease protein
MTSAAVATRLLTSLLFDVTPGDPITSAAITGIVAFIALTACYVPARRAAAVDPMVAMSE